MSGKIDIFLYYTIFSVAGLAAAIDLARAKIPNFLTFPAMLVGLLLSVLHSQGAGLGDSLLGIALPFLGTVWIYALGWLGAGDVKLYMALGALGGWRFGVEVVIVSFVVGGAFSLLVLMKKNQLIPFLRKLYRYVVSRTLRGLEPEPLQIGAGHRFPFALPIAISAIWTLIDQPLVRLGWRLW